MPKRQRLSQPRYVAKRRKMTRRRTKLFRRPTSAYRFTRISQGSQILASNAGAATGAYNFQLASLSGYTEFTALFDQYRIVGVEVQLIPNVTGSDANPLSTVVLLPNVHTVIDYDDDSTVGTLTTLMKYPSYRRTRGNQVHKRFLRPAAQIEVYKTAGTMGTSAKWGQWLDCGDSTIPLFGMKYYVDATNSATTIAYQVYFKYYLEFKGVI